MLLRRLDMLSAQMPSTMDEKSFMFQRATTPYEPPAAFDGIVGESAVLKVVLEEVRLVAPTDSTVLILGETGTGKELIARALHAQSKLSARPFIGVNCAAIPNSLIASELFGHEKGAFTGALQRRLGRFEAANHGTIFLDEIGELPMETQIALLRVIQEREFERVGSSHPISVDVRIIAATNRDLEAAVTAGTFPEDMFYRLNVFPIHVPALRERLDDIPLLVEHLVDRFAKRVGKTFRTIKMNTIALLQAYDWPGNIRELQNVIERSVILDHLVDRFAKRVGKTFRTIKMNTIALLQAYDWPGNIRELQNVIERSVILSVGDVFSVDEAWLRREARQARTMPAFAASIAGREKEM